MIILHTAFREGYYIWGELSFERAASALPVHGASLSWAAGAAQIERALLDAGVLRPSAQQRRLRYVSGYVSMPVCGGKPRPSSPLLGEVPRCGGEPALGLFKVPALTVGRKELAAISALLDGESGKLAVPGVIFADDARSLCNALKYAALLVSRGAFLPDMEKRDGSYRSIWRPLYLAKYQDEFERFKNSLPPSLFAFSTEKRGPEFPDMELSCELLIESLLDSIIRDSQLASDIKGRRVDSDNPHEIWLRSLGWPGGNLEKWNEDMAVLYGQIGNWIGSIKSVTGQPWKLFLRIEEPMAANGEEKLWTLSWHLCSVNDPSLIVPASRVWSPGPAERSWFDTIGANPRQFMLQVLGQLASSVPAIMRSLSERTPTECKLSAEELFRFLHDHAPAIIEQGIMVQYPAGWGDFSEGGTLAVKGRVSGGDSFAPLTEGGIGSSDLMDVDWSVSLDGDDLTAEELSMLSQLKTPLAEFRGRWVLLSKNEISSIIDGIKKLPEKISCKDALLHSVKESINGMPLASIGGFKSFDLMKAAIQGKEELEEADLPAGFNGTLRPYQARGLSWLTRLARLGLGGCLADDMGLGKTVQALALIHTLRSEGERRPVLLICPTSVMENWRLEAARFVPEERVLLHHGSKRLKGEGFAAAARESGIVISSYSLLHRDVSHYARVDWCGLILDEAQNIKNPATRQFKAARSIGADWRIALTGTPVENHAGDMWSIMEFSVPGLMPGRTCFARDFLRPIQAKERKATEKMKRLTGPFVLRRLKSDRSIVSELPEKIETKVFCSLSREQATLYKSVLSVMDDRLAESDGIKRRGVVLSAINSLKQICNHPALYLKDKSELPGRSGKLDRLTDITEEMLSAGDSMLIFTQYAEMGAMLKDYMQNIFGREVLFLHGAVERRKRDEIVARFQSGGGAPQIFVLSLRAGGTGLNLTRANHVIMFDRWWNPAVERQAVDRVHRIGQNKSVQIHYFSCKGTLEEKIESLIETKKEIAEAIVGSGERWITELSDDEVVRLLTLGDGAVEER
jgi:superfamily II DNA or RNA helicase